MTSRFAAEDTSINTHFVPCSRFGRWTFEDAKIRKWVVSQLNGRVLNACAGRTVLDYDGEIVRNDIRSETEDGETIPTDVNVDVAELSCHFDAESFDTILFDPPWSLYQSNLRYDGEHVQKDGTDIDTTSLPFGISGGREKSQLGHARLAKEGFNYLLRPGGRVVELTFHGTCMPRRLGYNRLERVIFDPVGEGKSVIGSVDEKVQRSLTPNPNP